MERRWWVGGGAAVVGKSSCGGCLRESLGAGGVGGAMAWSSGGEVAPPLAFTCEEEMVGDGW